MSSRILVVGGVAGGASVAARLRRLDAHAEIVIFERGDHVSFSNCCLPYHLSGTISDSNSLVLMTPERFHAQYDIEVRVRSEVTSIDRAAKQVFVRDLSTGATCAERYDKLVLSPGAAPVMPASIPGIGKPHVFSVRNVADIEAVKQYMDLAQAKKAVVVGGGFIGVEVAENLRMAGLEVALVEGMDQIMAPFDSDMAQILHKELLDHGVCLHLSSTLAEIGSDSVQIKERGGTKQIPADLVIMAIGVRPETGLAASSGLAIGETGGIWVNHNYQTSDPDIYAVGDAVENYNSLLHRPGRLALAGPAQRQARTAADHICGVSGENRGFIGSSCVRIFQQNAACTGLNERTARAAGIPCEFAYTLSADKVSLMPDCHYVNFKLLFEVPTGRILGAQAIGRGDVNRRIDVIAAMISMGGTLEDLKELELCYSPVFSTARDVVNLAALVGLNLLYGRCRQVPVSQVRELVESGAFIVDVREEAEYRAGHLLNARNIPLSQLRQRMDEIPKDIPVYLHCRTSQRSYNAICCLQGHGWSNLWNISGSFLGICQYEYFRDQSEGRASIVTAYNFN